MNKAKKKLLSTSLSLAMAANLVPMSGLQSVSAESGSANNIPFVDDANSEADDVFSIPKAESIDDMVMPSLKMSTVKLLANDTKIYTSNLESNSALVLTEDTTLVVDSDITLKSITGKSYNLAIQNSGNTTHKLTVYNLDSHAVYVNSITSSGVDLDITSVKDGLSAQEDITINSGSLTINSATDSIYSYGGSIYLYAKTQAVSASGHVIYSRCGSITTNCDLTVRAFDKKKSCIQAGFADGTGFTVNNNITLEGADIRITSIYDAVSTTCGSVSLSGSANIISSKGKAIYAGMIDATEIGGGLYGDGGVNLSGKFEITGKTNAYGDLKLLSGSITSNGGLFAQGNISLKGDIDASSDDYTIYAYNGTIYIEGDELTAKSTSSKKECIRAGWADGSGFSHDNNITIKSKDIDISSVNDCIYSSCGFVEMLTDNARITSSNMTAIRAQMIDATSIGGSVYGDGGVYLIGDYELSGKTGGIFCIRDLRLSGGSITSNGTLFSYKAIDLTGDINVKASQNDYAIFAENGNVTINGDLTATTTDGKKPCIQAGSVRNDGWTVGNVTIKSNNINISSINNAVVAKPGSINISSDNPSNLIISSSNGSAIWASIADASAVGGGVSYGGTVTINGPVIADGKDYGVIAHREVTIKNNGTVIASGNDAAIYSYGKINLPAYGSILSPENGYLRTDGQTIVNASGTTAKSVKIGMNPITGTARIKGLAKDVGDTLELELTGVPTPIARCTWQRSADQETWYNVASVSDISTYTTKAGDATYYFRAKITSRGYSGEIYSDVRYINKNVLSGSIVYTSSVSCGEIVSTGLTGELNALYSSTPNGVHFQWQSSTDGSSGWTNISGATSKSYIPNASDLGKYIRLVVTADKYRGELYSTPQKVSKPSNLNTPVIPELSTSDPYTSIVISNAKADQEYLLSTSDQTPTDWSNAVSPTSNGSLTFNCNRYYRYYVHTRFKETDTQSAGKWSKYGTIYTNTSDYIKGFTFDKTSFDTKVGEVTALTVKPVPEDWAGWDDTYTIKWFVNSSNPSNKEVELYTDPECTQEIDSTTFISNKTIYVKGIAQTRSVTVGVEKQVGQTDLLHDYCYVRVADADGNYALDELIFNETTVLQGETAILYYETDPTPATVGELTFEKFSGPEGGELTLTDNSDGSVSVAVPADAARGTYTYIVKVDGNEPTIRSYITVNVVSSTVSVKFFKDGGSGDMDSATVKKGSEFILPECGFTAPVGKEFAGWKISDTIYSPGDGVIITQATPVRAQWKDHVHSMAHIPAMSATCTMAGNTEYYICDDCGKWYSDAEGTTEIKNHASVVIAATDHTPAAAVKENEVSATCTEDGGYDEVVYCSVCGDEISRTHHTEDATGHNLTLVPAKEPTNTASGNKAYYVCSKCGEWFEDAEGTTLITDHSEYIITPISNTIIGASITLDGDIGVNFYTALTDDVSKAVLSGPNGDVVLEAADLALLKQTTGANVGTYKLTYPVNATQAGETISLKLYDSTDKQLDIYKSSGAIDDDKTFTYSVNEYIETSSNYITDAKLNNLVSALDNYCKAAENEFNDSSNTISGINNVNLESFEPYMFKKTGSETAKIALVLNSETSIRITYNGTGAVKYGSKTLTKSADGYYYIKNIPAHELVTGKTLKLGDTTFTNFSALSYGYTVLNGGSTDPDLQKLVKALLKYAEAADAYKNN